MRTRSLVVLFVALIGIRLVSVVVALESATTRSSPHAVLPGDVRRYHQIQNSVGTPYRDFQVEYPPISLAAIEALDGASVRSATVQLMWSQLVLDFSIAAIVAWGWGRRASLAYLILGLPFAAYPFLYLRLDLLSVTLAIGALALIRKRRAVSGGILLAVSCLAKVWPVVLAPGLMIRRRRALLPFVIAGFISTTAWIVWGGFDGPVQVITFRSAPGWQIESTIGAIVRLMSSAPVRIQSGADRIGVIAGWARWTLTFAGAGLVSSIWWLTARIRHADRHVLDGLAPLAAVTALLVTSTILSPQYVCWLVPFAAIAAVAGERTVATLTFAICSLSVLGFFFIRALNRGAAFPVTVVLMRNGLLVALLCVTVVRLWQLAHRTPIVWSETQREDVAA